jgi:hypothetical protein
MADVSDTEARVFDYESRFQQMAKRPGGLPREKALAEAHANIEKAKPGFDDWVHMEMQGLAAAIDTARSGVPTEQWVEQAHLHARAMRDVGTTMGVELLTFVAQLLCDVLEAVEAGAACDLDTLLCYFDALGLVRQPEYRGVSPDQVPELTRGLRRLAGRISIVPDQGAG